MFEITSDLTQQLNRLEETKAEELEIEAMIGSRRGSGFSNELSCSAHRSATMLLQENKSWTRQEERLVYDYYTPDKVRIRTFTTPDQRHVTESVKKISLSCRDFTYGEQLVRVNMKREQPVALQGHLHLYTAVKVSFRRIFVTRSTCCPSISFRYELIRFWTGQTRQEVDRKMLTDPKGKCAFECEIEGPIQQLPPAQRSLVFCSLALKMRDILEAARDDKHVPRQLGFQLLREQK